MIIMNVEMPQECHKHKTVLVPITTDVLEKMFPQTKPNRFTLLQQQLTKCSVFEHQKGFRLKRSLVIHLALK